MLIIFNFNFTIKSFKSCKFAGRQNSNVAFIGLGQMGHRMVNNLIKQGKTPRVYDVVPSAITSIKGR